MTPGTYAVFWTETGLIHVAHPSRPGGPLDQYLPLTTKEARELATKLIQKADQIDKDAEGP